MHESENWVKSLSRVRLLATPWAAVYQAPLSMGFSRQEYWSGVPLPSPVMANMFMYIWVLQILKNEKKKDELYPGWEASLPE